uniref:Uncharacterized protein n=1 Tax=Populus trichocarpa TaxID=3694 RepID=A0A2K1ZIJ2_POPTR
MFRFIIFLIKSGLINIIYKPINSYQNWLAQLVNQILHLSCWSVGTNCAINMVRTTLNWAELTKNWPESD